mmetsp:Transcript_63272/g.150908  ORF Transcript_63272/g.150908 Transcript_63272/m.150908 type:complete len:411 (-) Transcript_63272:106-1338(-)|eukprot:CAMPEP_0178431848 /NCGR_PEP_ID=MMETSP0689_2-20121128/32074_1 /TAXON_ID=160604 /ORGANISM="Amphidinium massartii, Strain CS-259" /LENGTH=410 /DNA_ID=CAMNT_0020053803 /DNA_START=62 /DNA_END=1294 /DNA_ORIENTATION=-
MGANQSGAPEGKEAAAAKAAGAPPPSGAEASSAPAAPAAKSAASPAKEAAPKAASAGKKEKAPKEPKASESKEAVEEEEAPDGFVLCVRKLDENVTTEMLKGVFEAKGPVVKAEVKTNEDGKCRGLGIIIVPTKEDADKIMANVSAYEVNGKAVDIRPTKGRGKGRERSSKGADGEGASAAAPPSTPATNAKGKSGKGAKGKGKEGKGSGGGKTSLAATAGAPEFVPGSQNQYDVPNPEMYAYYHQMYAARQYMMYQAMMQAAYANQYSPQQAAAAAAAQGVNPNMQAAQAQSAAAQAQGGEKGGKDKGKGGASKKKGASKGAAPKQDKAPRKEVPTDQVFKGTLKSVSQRNGYGFLASPEAFSIWERDVYVDATKELEPQGIKLNDEVQFNVVLSDKNHPQAMNVKKVG